MPTFSTILRSLPDLPDEPSGAPKHLGIFIFLCVVASAALAGSGVYWSHRMPIFIASIPLSLAVTATLAKLVFDIKALRPFFKNPGSWLAERLDDRFAQEKLIAAELAATDQLELKRMKARLEADLVRIERWMDVLKPLSMLAPVVLILVSLGVFNLLAMVQDIAKLVVASATVGAIAAVIAIHQGSIKLRLLCSTLHHAIELAEENKKPSFRRVSRKRGLPG